MILPRWALPLAWAAAGALTASAAVDLLAALSGPDAPLGWWLARASGLVAYAALWLVMTTGVLLAGKGAGGLVEPAVALGLHQRWMLTAVVATSLHVLVVVLDDATDVPAVAALLPGASPTLRGPVALGAVAVWGLGALVTTSVLRARVGPTVWRAVHALAFGAFLIALAHGWTAGTESTLPAVRALYLATGSGLLALTVQRALLAAWPGRVSG